MSQYCVLNESLMSDGRRGWNKEIEGDDRNQAQFEQRL